MADKCGVPFCSCCKTGEKEPDYFVAGLVGDDSNDGTEERPFATIGRVPKGATFSILVALDENGNQYFPDDFTPAPGMTLESRPTDRKVEIH